MKNRLMIVLIGHPGDSLLSCFAPLPPLPQLALLHPGSRFGIGLPPAQGWPKHPGSRFGIGVSVTLKAPGQLASWIALK